MDILLLIKASYYLTDDQWKSVKELVSTIGNSVNIGRTKKTSQIGVVLFDNFNKPNFAIDLDSYGRSSDFSIASQKLKLLPCGSWCEEQKQKADVEQIELILSKQSFKRLTKVFIISSQYIDNISLQNMISFKSQMLIQQILIPQAVETGIYSQAHYNYYQSYYDQYRRYANRIHQLYPYLRIQIPQNQYVYPGYYQNSRYNQHFQNSQYYQNSQNDRNSQYHQNSQNDRNSQYYQNIKYSDSSSQEKNQRWVTYTCFYLIGCQQCFNPLKSQQTEENIDSDVITIHSGDSKSSKAKISFEKKIEPTLNNVSKAISEPNSDLEYEYEIIADPPGLKINKTPLLDEVDEKSVDDSQAF